MRRFGRVLSYFGHRMRSVEIEVQFQHIDPRFAQEAQLAAFGVLGNQLANSIFTHPTFAGHARHLELGAGGSDVRDRVPKPMLSADR